MDNQLPVDQAPIPPLPPQGQNGNGSPTIEDLLKSAQTLLGEIAQIRDTARAAAAGVENSEKQLSVALTDAQTKLTEISAVATQAGAAKTKITDDQAVIATKSDHIQKAQEHADKVRADLDRALTAATQSSTAAEGQATAAKKSAETANEAQAKTGASNASAEKDAASTATALAVAQTSAATAKKLADKSEAVDKRLMEYEIELDKLKKQSADQLKAITDLLPGATTAGLAHSFDARRQTFLRPHNIWQGLFVVSILAIIILAITGVWEVHQLKTTPTYDELFRLWLCRLPIAGALVWLALHSSREAALAKRLEEDYGFKAATAEAFLGFHKQMMEIGGSAGTNKPLAKLCEDTLTTIANPPGRIYDKHKLTVTPADEIKEAAKAAGPVLDAIKPK